MFVFATFINMIVFMNMLIAIMGDTFTTVMAAQEESGLQEMVTLMTDNIWVYDISKEFTKYKYLVRMS